MYGMGKNKLANMLGVSFQEAQNLIAKYNSKAPFVKQLSDRCMQKANGEGVIRTKLGRKCRFDMWETKILAYIHRRLLRMPQQNMVHLILRNFYIQSFE